MILFSYCIALLWLISRLSSSQAKGHYSMIVSNDAISKEYMKELIEKAPIRENDSLLTSICAKFNPLENLDDVSHLDFNLIPRDDAKLTIDHEGEQYLVWFDRETEETEKKTDGQTLHSEPSLVIQKAEGSQKKTTIKDMYEWVVRISRLYDRYMDNFDERFRYEYDSENGWDVSNTLHVSRGLSAVSLDKPQEKILKKDLETFMKDREFYVRMGMPYRRGYLFSGKPGTGKTSLIHAISAAYKRNLYYINLKEIKNDANLQSAFSNIAKNSIAVLEDVDAQSSVVHNRKDTLIDGKLIRKVLQASTENLEENPSTDTKDEQQSEVDESEIGPVRLNGFKFGGPSLSTLLNCLDGYTLNDGIIIIMTSNHPELLDPALIRPGRIDLHLELGYCTHYQIQHMFDNVMNMKSDPDQKLKPTDEIEVKKGMMNTKVVDNPGIQVQKSEISLDLSGIPEGVIPPCDAMRILLLYRTDSPEIITQKLKERAEELLSGKAVGEPMNLDNEQ
ncbi:P-loop containing nucleoside triphosphate hydrolase protein [Globomyces pollinis-pini]|nr:P-loop containing nucleoside triphosphate hydrolase protein [Globomyces pollinis-pini]